MREFFATINLKELLKVSVFPIFIMLYILYPLWMLSDDPLIVVIIGYGLIAMPFLIRVIIDSIWSGEMKEISIDTLIRSRKVDLIFFAVTSVAYWILLSSLILAPLLPRGDEPTHVARIIVVGLLWTFDGLVSNLTSAIVLLVGLISVVFFILVWSSPKRESFILWPVLRFLFKSKFRYLIYMGFAILPIFMGLFSNYFNVGTYSLTRYGPFHPIVFVLPYLILGYSKSVIIAWKTFNLLIMVGAAAIIRRFTSEILETVNEDLGPSTKKNLVLSTLAGLIFLTLPPVIQFSTEIYLTSGVALLFAVNCLLFLRTLRASDDDQQHFYLVALALFLGFSTLWKRVLLVQAAAIFVILFIILMLRDESDKKESALLMFKTGIIYACIFGPWFVLVQLRGYIWREYLPELTNILPPNLFDYLFRFDTQAGMILGILGYMSLTVLFILSFVLRNRLLMILAPQFVLWYIFFNLDAGWPHTVDRFFVPVLALMIVSTIVIIGMLFTHSKHYVNRFSIALGMNTVPSITSPTRKSLVSFILLLALLGLTVAGTTQNILAGPVYVDNTLENKYVPYDQAAQFIDEQIDGNISLLYSVWGPNSLNFYLNLHGDYPLIGSSIGDIWQPDENNVTTEAFVEYLIDNEYTVLALPSVNLVNPELLPTEIVQALIEDYSSYGISDLEVFEQGANEFYVWLL